MAEIRRCGWAHKPADQQYHDEEWGVPVHDDRVLFEFLILEGAQAGLSWSTILAKRENYRKAFAGFDPRKVARFDEARLAKLLENPGIVRNRLKIHSTVTNAKAFLKVQKEFGSFDKFLWDFVGGKPIVNAWTGPEEPAGADTPIGRAEQRAAAAGLQICRLDDYLRLHAGRRDRQRPPGGLRLQGSGVARCSRCR